MCCHVAGWALKKISETSEHIYYSDFSSLSLKGRGQIPDKQGFEDLILKQDTATLFPALEVAQVFNLLLLKNQSSRSKGQKILLGHCVGFWPWEAGDQRQTLLKQHKN